MAVQNLFSVSDFVAVTNQILEGAYPLVEIEGEVASFKVNQGKFVFFDLKDSDASVGCFMMAWQLRLPIEDGMKVVIVATPKLTPWGKFSLTVKAIRPSGEGALKKSFDLLKQKLEAEGLFALERKRTLPAIPQHIAVVSSPEAAGYIDFIKILGDRWGGITIDVYASPVQGAGAADALIKAIEKINTREILPEVLVIVRGGGSADDLSVFNDELLVRAIAGSRVPTLVGVGHEVDVTLADLAADVRAATPSNAAQLLVPDRQAIIHSLQAQVQGVLPRIHHSIAMQRQLLQQKLQGAIRAIDEKTRYAKSELVRLQSVLAQLDPNIILARGYALVRGKYTVGSILDIETAQRSMKAEVKDVREK